MFSQIEKTILMYMNNNLNMKLRVLAKVSGISICKIRYGGATSSGSASSTYNKSHLGDH